MAKELARRNDTALKRPSGEYLERCTLKIEHHSRIIEDPSSPWERRELTGHHSGTFNATIADLSSVPTDLMNGPVVFEWPDGQMFIKMLIMRIDVEIDNLRARAHIEGRVLQIAKYGARRLTDAEARRQLGMPPKQLTE